MRVGTRTRRAAGWALAGTLVLAGCSGGDEAAPPPPTPPPAASPDPTPTEAAPVAMTPHVEARSVAADDVLSKSGGVTPGRTPMDEAAVAVAADAVLALLRDHLDDLNAGGGGMLAAAGPELWALDPAVADLATTGLASPENPATDADVVVRLGVDGTPRWAQVDLEVRRRDGTSSSLALVFATGEELELLVLGAGEVDAQEDEA